MIIVIFGCIGVGKSTLARLLVAKLKFNYLNADDIFRQERNNILTLPIKNYYKIHTKIELLKLIFRNREFSKLVHKQIWPAITTRITNQIKAHQTNNWVVETFDLSLLKLFSGYCFWLINYNASIIYQRIKMQYAELTFDEVKLIIRSQNQLIARQLKKFLGTSFCLVKINATSLSMQEVLSQVKSIVYK